MCMCEKVVWESVLPVTNRSNSIFLLSSFLSPPTLCWRCARMCSKCAQVCSSAGVCAGGVLEVCSGVLECSILCWRCAWVCSRCARVLDFCRRCAWLRSRCAGGVVILPTSKKNVSRFARMCVHVCMCVRAFVRMCVERHEYFLSHFPGWCGSGCTCVHLCV